MDGSQTAIFATSYFFRDAKTLRMIQAVAACVWLCYGLAIHSAPVIWSNVIVIAAALYSRTRAAAVPVAARPPEGD